MAADIVERVRQAGVVGAGGAGFPTHLKLQARVDTLIANGAECEPLLYKDKELMRVHPERLLRGLQLGMQATGAARGILAVKRAYQDAITALRPHLFPGVEICELESYYPVGDEYSVVHETTGRWIPPAGLPLAVGCVVQNVETLINVARAQEGEAVIRKWITVSGAVHRPCSFAVPVGITAREAIQIAEGATVEDPVAIEGGPMMGRVVQDLEARVTKLTGGYTVLPRDHQLIRRKTRPPRVQEHISRSACDQCVFCTELCPRFLLGYAVEPHKVMRSVGFTGATREEWTRWGLLCCECGLCSLYACPEDLPPAEMCIQSRAHWAERGERPEPLAGLGRPHPMMPHRKVPLSRLTSRLGLTPWDVPAPMVSCEYQPDAVRLLLQQHLGSPARPTVRSGQQVREGELVAEMPEGERGSGVHASIPGTVTRIDEHSIWLSRGGA